MPTAKFVIGYARESEVKADIQNILKKTVLDYQIVSKSGHQKDLQHTIIDGLNIIVPIVVSSAPVLLKELIDYLKSPKNSETIKIKNCNIQVFNNINVQTNYIDGTDIKSIQTESPKELQELLLQTSLKDRLDIEPTSG